MEWLPALAGWKIHARSRAPEPSDGTPLITARVFDDPDTILMLDRVTEGEQRWHAPGTVSSALLLAVHVHREDELDGEEIIRIISAREANQRACRIYIQQAAE